MAYVLATDRIHTREAWDEFAARVRPPVAEVVPIRSEGELLQARRDAIAAGRVTLV